MNGEITANAVAGTMPVGESTTPERSSCERIEIRAVGAGGKGYPREGEMPFEDQGVPLRFFTGWRTAMERSGDIGRTIEILPAAIKKQKRVVVYPER
jgi:hypothetical protein